MNVSRSCSGGMHGQRCRYGGRRPVAAVVSPSLLSLRCHTTPAAARPRSSPLSALSYAASASAPTCKLAPCSSLPHRLEPPNRRHAAASSTRAHSVSPTGGGSSRRLLVLHGDEAAWYWGPVGAVAAAAAVSDDGGAVAEEGDGEAADDERRERAEAAGRRISGAEGFWDLLEVAREDGEVLALSDIRKLLLRWVRRR
jgi:hypothetical protein